MKEKPSEFYSKLPCSEKIRSCMDCQWCEPTGGVRFRCTKNRIEFTLNDDYSICEFFMNEPWEGSEKPPMGIEPYWLYACERISEICTAIQRTIMAADLDLTALRRYTKEIGALSDYLETMRNDKE